MKSALVALFTAFVLAGLAIAGAPRAYAHDIEIYTNPTSGTSGEPLVMFSIDTRSSNGSTVCSANNCPADVVALYTDGYMAQDPATTSITEFDLMRGVLNEVFSQLQGVQIGIMLNHNDNTSNDCLAGTTGSTGTTTGTNHADGTTVNYTSGCSTGGYIVYGFHDINNSATAPAIKNVLNAIPEPGGNTSNPYQGIPLFFELFRYLTGQGIFNGHNGWTDYGTNGQNDLNDNAFYTSDGVVFPDTTGAPLSWDTGIENGANYVTPISDNCAKIFTINIMFGVDASDKKSNPAILAPKSQGGMAGITFSNNQNQNFASVLSWLYNTDLADGTFGSVPNYSGIQNVVSYFIVPSGGGANSTTFSTYAGAGVGQPSATPYYLSGDPTTLADTINNIFKKILSVNTTFVAPSVAVNAYNQAQVLNDVYIAMFRADPNGLPAWPGNVKKYMLGTDPVSGLPEIQDATGANAIDPVTGNIAQGALSYWTIPSDLPYPTSTSDYVAGKDGYETARGGAGSLLPGFELHCASATDTSCYPGLYNPGFSNPSSPTTNQSARMLFTDPASPTNGTDTALTPLNADVPTATALQSALGASTASTATTGDCTSADTTTSPPDACALLLYARGMVYNATANAWNARPWIMGDVLHSRPLVINYGARPGYSAKDPDLRIVFGGNDGFMHMVRDSNPSTFTPSATNQTMAGVETWGFMPQAVMGQLSALEQNTALTNAATDQQDPHPFLTDGSPAVYMYDANGDGTIEPSDGDKVYLYFGLRRGGQGYYALDISDPDNPQILWKINKSMPGFGEIGQTWSKPQVAYMVFNGSNTPEPVVIFAGGYDINKDTHSPHTYANGGNDTMGMSIYVVNAQTGVLIWKAIYGSTTGYNATTQAFTSPNLLDSIPSNVTAVDSDGNGLVDRLYVGDTGGDVWRVDMASNDQSNWQATWIFNAGRHYDSTDASADRRFFYAPDYVQAQDSTGAYDAVILGSGDREYPLGTTVTNYMYMLKDRDTTTMTSSTQHWTGGTQDPGNTALYDQPITPANLADVTSDCLQTSGCSLSTTDSQNLQQYGWDLQLECPPSYTTPCGEKVLAPAYTLAGTIYFTTYQPPSTSTTGCQLSQGTGLLYAVSLANGDAVYNFNPSASNPADHRYEVLPEGGIPSSVVSLGNGNLLLPSLTILSTNTGGGFKAYWYKDNHQ